MTQPNITRRRLIQASAVALAGLWVWGAPRLPQLWQGASEFEPIAGAAPFRRLLGQGDITLGNAALIALEPAAPNPLRAATRADLCGALFQGQPGPAIALFSDFNCPNCPQMDANVTAAARDTGTPVIRHQLPLLGRTSELASRAAIAADLQDGYAALSHALFRTPAVRNINLIRRFASDAGLDPDQLEQDMHSDITGQRLLQSKALAEILGLFGTPAAVIGRSVVLGTLPERRIAQIIAIETDGNEGC